MGEMVDLFERIVSGVGPVEGCTERRGQNTTLAVVSNAKALMMRGDFEG